MTKGDRVKIARGKGTGVAGTIFWVGENRYGPGQRFGIKGDDGETYWSAEDQLEAADVPPPPEPEGPVPNKGDRVEWTQGGASGFGRVFWVGQSRSGPGMRFGVEDDDGETRWLDQRFVKVTDAAGAPPPARRAPRDEQAGQEEPAWDDAPAWDEAPAVGEPPAWDEPPPWDFAPVVEADEE